jgi:hypothetical protein
MQLFYFFSQLLMVRFKKMAALKVNHTPRIQSPKVDPRKRNPITKTRQRINGKKSRSVSHRS